MGRRRPWIDDVMRVALGVVVGLGLCAGVAHARAWAKWAPEPLASDSAYAALGARVADSLDVGQLGWVEVQRDWRRQRREESQPFVGGITGGREHHGRPDDGRFAALAARPYTALSASERAWLVIESSEQRQQRAREGQTGTTVVLVVLAVGAGVVVGALLMAHAINESLAHL